MSRIGNAPVVIADGVTAEVRPGEVVVRGPKGELTVTVPHGITVKQEEKNLLVTRKRNDTKIRAMHGTIAALLSNAVAGVTKGWEKKLELHGVGYRAMVQGSALQLTVGFSHPVTITPPVGITFTVADGGKITVSGIDKHMVGQTAASVRDVRPPEPYKGKGIRYAGEHIRKKAGKSAKGVGGAPGAK